MKVLKPETIEDSEKDFIDLLNAELDWEAIEKLLLEKHNFTLQEEIEYNNGDIVIHKDSIAYKMEFTVKVPLSVILNRNGEFIELLTSQTDETEELNEDEKREVDTDEDFLDESGDKNKLAANIANMISEINQED